MKLPDPILKVEFVDSDDGHLYRVDGKDLIVPGVTTILRILGKPALVPWAAKKAAEAFLARVDEEMPKLIDGKIKEIAFDEIAKWAAGAPNRERDTAGAKGTDVHAVIENHLHGIELSPEFNVLSPVGKSFNNFRKWELENSWKVIVGDTPLISLDMGYGGRMDGLFLDEKERIVLVDFKTAKGVYPDNFVQLGGYSLALMETYGIRPHRCGVLHIRPEKCEWHEGDLSLGEQTFRRAVEIYYLIEKIKKQMEENKNAVAYAKL